MNNILRHPPEIRRRKAHAREIREVVEVGEDKLVDVEWERAEYVREVLGTGDSDGHTLG